MGKSVIELRRNLRTAKSVYSSRSASCSEAEAARMESDVAMLMHAIAVTISEGAGACPRCGSAPSGREVLTARGYEYEVGCASCSTFDHDDGSHRRPAARAALPKYAVDAWNEGPDFWLIVPR